MPFFFFFFFFFLQMPGSTFQLEGFFYTAKTRIIFHIFALNCFLGMEKKRKKKQVSLSSVNVLKGIFLKKNK